MSRRGTPLYDSSPCRITSLPYPFCIYTLIRNCASYSEGDKICLFGFSRRGRHSKLMPNLLSDAYRTSRYRNALQGTLPDRYTSYLCRSGSFRRKTFNKSTVYQMTGVEGRDLSREPWVQENFCVRTLYNFIANRFWCLGFGFPVTVEVVGVW